MPKRSLEFSVDELAETLERTVISEKKVKTNEKVSVVRYHPISDDELDLYFNKLRVTAQLDLSDQERKGIFFLVCERSTLYHLLKFRLISQQMRRQVDSYLKTHKTELLHYCRFIHRGTPAMIFRYFTPYQYLKYLANAYLRNRRRTSRNPLHMTLYELFTWYKRLQLRVENVIYPPMKLITKRKLPSLRLEKEIPDKESKKLILFSRPMDFGYFPPV